MPTSGPEVLLEFVEAFREADLPFMVVGAFSVMVYGMARFSDDIDIVVRMPFEERQVVAEIFEEKGLPYEEKVDPMWGKRLMALHPSQMKVEVFFTPDHPLHIREYERRQVREYHGVMVPFQSPEDLILRKLVNTRLRRAEDYDDVLTVIAVQGDALDHSYIREHCAVHRVCDLFERAMKDAATIASGKGQAWEPPEEGWPPPTTEEE